MSLSFISFATISLGLNQPPDEPQPKVEDFNKRTSQLEIKNSAAERLEAIKWLTARAESIHASLAVPGLERCLKTDPDAEVRGQAVQCRAMIAAKRNESCPLSVVEAMLDKDESVSQLAATCGELFKTFSPGSSEILLRCTKSKNAVLRSGCLTLLARAGGKEKNVVEAIRQARKDKSFAVRHSAHVALFQTTDDLPEYLTYFIRLQEDPEGALGRLEGDADDVNRERVTLELARLGSATLIAKWSDDRPSELASALVKLLGDPTPAMRRGAARLIGAASQKIDQKSGTEPSKGRKRTRQPEPSSAVPYFQKLNAMSRLRELAENDIDATVRNAAGAAMKTLAAVQPIPKLPRL